MSGTDARLRWSRLYAQGPLAFIIKYGVLGWGLATAVLYTLIMALAGAGNLGLHLLFGVVLFPLFGWPVGWLAWRAVVRRHRQETGS